MDGVIFLLDQAGRTIIQLQARVRQLEEQRQGLVDQIAASHTELQSEALPVAEAAAGLPNGAKS
jgi:hypothetical protein